MSTDNLVKAYMSGLSVGMSAAAFPNGGNPMMLPPPPQQQQLLQQQQLQQQQIVVAPHNNMGFAGHIVPGNIGAGAMPINSFNSMGNGGGFGQGVGGQVATVMTEGVLWMYVRQTALVPVMTPSTASLLVGSSQQQLQLQQTPTAPPPATASQSVSSYAVNDEGVPAEDFAWSLGSSIPTSGSMPVSTTTGYVATTHTACSYSFVRRAAAATAATTAAAAAASTDNTRVGLGMSQAHYVGRPNNDENAVYFDYPGKRGPVVINVSQVMQRFSATKKSSISTIREMIKCILDTVFRNKDALLNVTAGTGKSKKGFQSIREESLRDLAKYWRDHFECTHHHPLGEVKEAFANQIQIWLCVNRSRVKKQPML